GGGRAVWARPPHPGAPACPGELDRDATRHVYHIELDEFERIFSNRRRFGQHHGTRLADISNLVAGYDALEIGNSLVKHLLAQWDDGDLADILAGDDRSNPREPGSSTNIEMRDPAMRHRAAENDRAQL